MESHQDHRHTPIPAACPNEAVLKLLTNERSMRLSLMMQEEATKAESRKRAADDALKVGGVDDTAAAPTEKTREEQRGEDDQGDVAAEPDRASLVVDVADATTRLSAQAAAAAAATEEQNRSSTSIQVCAFILFFAALKPSNLFLLMHILNASMIGKGLVIKTLTQKKWGAGCRSLGVT